MKRYASVLVQLLIWAAMPIGLRAEKYALIAGVGRFLYLSEKNNLAGARPDAEKMAQMLTRYGFGQDKMILLLDKDGTRDAFLAGIDHLVDIVTEGDQVVIYFSGHGTSSLDENGGFGMDADTGAVLPSDLKPAKTKEEILAQLILGKRDLRPRLSRLEQKASVLVIFDSCFSGESVKGISSGNQHLGRYISLAELTNGDVSTESIVAAELSSARASRDYPYHRVVYFSAASKGQFAWDMPSEVYQTFDGLSHGAFTNVFLKLLNDGTGSRVGCLNLYGQVNTMVHQQGVETKHSQDPQFLYGNDAQVKRPCFSTPQAATPAPPPSAQPQPPPPTNAIRTEIDRLAAGAAFQLNCSASQLKPARSAEQNKDLVSYSAISCNVPESGYLQIISYGMGDSNALIVFPNDRHRSNAVAAGPVQIPNGSEFNIENYLPSGMSHQEQVMLVIFSNTDIDARSLGVSEGIFTSIPTKAFRTQRVSGPIGYGAAKLVFEISSK